jgi:hypothetical protein
VKVQSYGRGPGCQADRADGWCPNPELRRDERLRNWQWPEIAQSSAI